MQRFRNPQLFFLLQINNGHMMILMRAQHKESVAFKNHCKQFCRSIRSMRIGLDRKNNTLLHDSTMSPK